MDSSLNAPAAAALRGSSRWRAATPLALVGLAWALIVASGMGSHEFWRDEVRALSLALAADRLWQLPAAIQGEGHPLLWYALLRLAHEVWPSTRVLPLVSLLCGAAGVAIFLVRSPFALWWKALFVLGALPLYEYVVMARNYGVSMLLMFAFAALLCQRRASPVALGGVLFLLAQTNVHSALLVPLLAAVWVAQWLAAPARPCSAATLLLGLALAGIGLLCTLLSIFPARHTLITSNLALTAYAGGNFLKGVGLALVEPGFFFRKLTLLPVLPSTLLLYALAFGLVRRPLLMAAAVLGLWAHAALFALVYAGELRHQGVWLIFVVTLYWIALGTRGPRRLEAGSIWPQRAFGLGLNLVMPLLLALQCTLAWALISRDLQLELSKSAALAHALAEDPALRGAVLVAQPDEFVESLPYYVDNPTYLLRERRPGHTATWSLTLPRTTRLDDDLRQIRMLQARTGRPVVLIMSHRWADNTEAELSLPEDFGRTFELSAQARRTLARTSTRLPLGADAVRETFDAYVFR